MAAARQAVEAYDGLYEIVIGVVVDPGTVDGAFDELEKATKSTVELRDSDYGLIRVAETVVAPDSHEAYRRVTNRVESQLECAGLASEGFELFGHTKVGNENDA